jgi:hypothetical protein
MLKPSPIEPVPEATARVARAAFRKGTPLLKLRDELGTIFADADFANGIRVFFGSMPSVAASFERRWVGRMHAGPKRDIRTRIEGRKLAGKLRTG